MAQDVSTSVRRRWRRRRARHRRDARVAADDDRAVRRDPRSSVAAV